MALKPFLLLSFILVLFQILFPSCKSSSTFDSIKELEGCHKANYTKGIHHLKTYLQQFGYLNHDQTNNDDFDDSLESAIKIYQQNYHIKPTGILDAKTVSTMITPRCGVPDIDNGINYMQSDHNSSSHHSHMVSHYSFFPGYPRWPRFKRRLTYRFLPGFPSAAMDPVRRAFQKWTSATQYFTFYQVQTNSDITIGFFRGFHGDNAPFDGRGGTLAHAYAPTDGRFHFDADESWSVNPVPNAFHLETIAVHEIGHLLGLGHSSVRNAIMFPTVAPGRIVNINPDDIRGIRALYGF